jgi:hypothetical protein
MITIKEFCELICYRITEGSNYSWKAFGPNAFTIDSWDGRQDSYSIHATFDKRTQLVYQVELWDYSTNKIYRCINPDYQFAVEEEYLQRGTAFETMDDDMILEDVSIEKFTAIVNGRH